MNSKTFPRKERWVTGLLFIWVCVVFLHFFSIKSFIDFSFVSDFFKDASAVDANKFLANWFFFLKVLSVAVLAFFTLWRWGRKLRLSMGWSGENAALRFSLEMGLGMLFFNGLWLGLGLNGLWFKTLILPLGLVLGGGALWDCRENIRTFQRFPKIPWPKGKDRFFAGGGMVFFLLCLGHSAVPETYYDGLVYHLSTLQFWMDRHGIADFSTNLYAHYPFGAELYFLNGFFFLGGEAAKTLNAFLALLLALGACGWAEEEGGDGWMTWMMVWSFPLVSSSVWDARNDVALAFFLLLFFGRSADGIPEKRMERNSSRPVFGREGPWRSNTRRSWG